MEELRLYCHLFWVDVRISQIEDRWIASADTPDGPTVGTAMTREGALYLAPEGFAEVRDELLGSMGGSSTEEARL